MLFSAVMRGCLLGLIRLYQRYLSPLKPPTCRFYPTCSEFAIQSIELHGWLGGSWFAFRRICRCHPFHPGGIDPVPPRVSMHQHPPQE